MTKRMHICLVVLLLCPALIGAADLELNVVRFPERETVEISMLPTRRVPSASMKAKIRFQEGQSRIELSYDNMKPAVLFGGDVTCYVLWAVNRDGGIENLGELWVRPDEDKDTLRFSTGLRTFALVVTAESYYQVEQPSELVIFWNDRSPDPRARNDQLAFSSFVAAPRFGMESLAIVRYDGNTPLDLLQAEKAFEIAGRMQAQDYAPAIYREADIALQQARTMSRASQARRGAQEYARRSVASSNEAIKISLREIRAQELEKRIAERQAAMNQLEEKAAEAQSRASQAEEQAAKIRSDSEAAIAGLQKQKAAAEEAVTRAKRELTAIQREKESMEATKRELESNLDSMRQEQEAMKASLEAMQQDMAGLRQEKELLESRLQDALSHVAETRESARGFIVNLPDILFDVNEAALKQEAKIVLSKLAGILLIMQDLNLRVEGHTDSTGSASYNLELSRRRAESVLTWLADEGIASQRMRAFGYGLDRPIADNSSAEGRRRNRRVEIIISEGEIQEELPPR